MNLSLSLRLIRTLSFSLNLSPKYTISLSYSRTLLSPFLCVQNHPSVYLFPWRSVNCSSTTCLCDFDAFFNAFFNAFFEAISMRSQRNFDAFFNAFFRQFWCVFQAILMRFQYVFSRQFWCVFHCVFSRQFWCVLRQNWYVFQCVFEATLMRFSKRYQRFSICHFYFISLSFPPSYIRSMSKIQELLIS